LFFVIFCALNSQPTTLNLVVKIGNNIGNILPFEVIIYHKYDCKVAAYVLYLIGNNIGTNDQ